VSAVAYDPTAPLSRYLDIYLTRTLIIISITLARSLACLTDSTNTNHCPIPPACGCIFCFNCSNYYIDLPPEFEYVGKQRVCLHCYSSLSERSKTEGTAPSKDFGTPRCSRPVGALLSPFVVSIQRELDRKRAGARDGWLMIDSSRLSD